MHVCLVYNKQLHAPGVIRTLITQISLRLRSCSKRLCFTFAVCDGRWVISNLYVATSKYTAV